jgi:hypothetical protein
VLDAHSSDDNAWTYDPAVPKPGDPEQGVTPAWYLGHVCRSWRDLALSYPALWSFISIPWRPTSQHLSRIGAQLLRAANAPLDIEWLDTRRNVNPQLLDLLFPHCGRWRSLRICGSLSSSEELDWLHHVNGRLPELKTLELVNCFRVVLPDIFSAIPNLRVVSLSDSAFQDFSPSVLIPWGRITSYRGTYAPKHQLKILEAAQNLRACSIGFINFPEFDPHTNSVVILPNVRRLCIEQPTFILNLTAPRLEGLSSAYNTKSSIRLLLPFIHRSACILKKLVLMRCTICTDLINVLQGILIENGNCDEHAQTKLFDAIANSGSRSDICPSLTFFAYGCQHDLPVPESFFAMAASRSLPHLRVFANGKPNFLADFVSRIRTLRNEGMDIAFLHDQEQIWRI